MYVHGVLVSFISTRHKPESFGKKRPQLRKHPIRLADGQDCDVLNPVCVVLPIGKWSWVI